MLNFTCLPVGRFLFTAFTDKIGMLCPFCNNSETKVVDSRDTNDGKITRRRRECLKCNARFSTYEEVELLRLAIIKKDGNRYIEKRQRQRRKK
jgi:transcriptional repressor NrdR